MLYENKLLGVPRLRLLFHLDLKSKFLLRMLRVRNDSCEIHEKFHGAIKVKHKNQIITHHDPHERSATTITANRQKIAILLDKVGEGNN